MRKDTFGHRPGIIQLGKRKISPWKRAIIAQGGSEVPLFQARDCRGEGIQQQLVLVKALSLLWQIGAIKSISVKLASANPPYPHVPDIPGAVASRIELDRPGWLSVARLVEELKPDAGGITAENGEVNPGALLVSAKGEREANPHIAGFADLLQVFRK
jgi:hypothetical protein